MMESYASKNGRMCESRLFDVSSVRDDKGKILRMMVMSDERWAFKTAYNSTHDRCLCFYSPSRIIREV